MERREGYSMFWPVPDFARIYSLGRKHIIALAMICTGSRLWSFGMFGPLQSHRLNTNDQLRF